jgi:hypothetical protein
MRPAHALSPRLMIGKEHQSVTPTRPTTGILTLRKVTTPRHPGTCSHVRLTSTEPTMLHCVRAVGWSGHGKVLIPNPDYKAKGCTELASSNPTPRVQRHRPPPKICGLPGMMEFIDDDIEEEEELSNEFMASVKQKITALDEQVTELHLAVYDQQDDFGVLCKVSTSKLKRFTKTLGDMSLYNAPSP